MKKKIPVILILLAIAVCALCLTACNKKCPHEWDEGITTTPATYTTTGVKLYTCSLCDKQRMEEIPKLAHNHRYSGEWYANGDSHWHKCDICGEPSTADAHAWGNGVTTRPATYIETGVKTYVCTVCGKEKIEEIPTIEHEHRFQGEWITNAEAHWHECSLCQFQEEQQEHQWDKGEVIKEPTTSAVGIKLFVCTVCYAEHREEIPMLPHTHHYSTAYFHDESTHWFQCDECGDKKDITMHSWDAGTVILEASTTVNGIKQYTCTVCSRKKTEELPMLPSSNQLQFVLSEDKNFYLVTGFDGVATDVEVPEIHNGLRVRGVAKEAFRDNATIKSVVLPKSITFIDEKAFLNCTNLERVVIPESVISIGESAFEGCVTLSRLSFVQPIDGIINTNMTIGDLAFSRCYSLTSVKLAHNTVEIGTSAFDSCSLLASVEFNEMLKIIGDSAFANCGRLNNISLPLGLMTIGAFTFDSCSALDSITIPDTVISLGKGAFRNALALRSATLSTTMTAVEDVTFQNCVSLTTVDVLPNIQSIGTSAFSGCVGMRTLYIRGNVNGIGNSAFYDCTSLQDIYYNSATVFSMGNEHYNFFNAGSESNGITLHIAASAYIPDGLFEPLHRQNVPKLKSIILEDGAEAISYFTKYSHLPYLTSVTMPDSLRRIAQGVFSGENPSVVEDNGVTYLKVNNGQDYFAVLKTDNISTITVKNGTRLLADKSFENHDNLTKVILPDTIVEMALGVLSGCGNLTEITLPFVGRIAQATLANYDTLFGYIFGTATYDNGVQVQQYYTDIYSWIYCIPANLDKVTVAGGTMQFGAFSNCTNFTSVTLGDNVSFVGREAFSGCSSLQSIAIGSGLSSIGTAAFANCGALESFSVDEENSYFSVDGNCLVENSSGKLLRGGKTSVISENIRSIGEYAFSGCEAIATITIPSGVTSIAEGSFANCTGLVEIIFAEGSLCRRIGDSAFYNNRALESITIPQKVTDVGEEAFAKCISLETVTFQKDSDCNRIGDAAFFDCSSLVEMTLPFVGTSKTADSASETTLFGYIFGTNSYDGGEQVRQYHSSGYGTNYYIPSSLRSVTILGGEILYGAFYGCKNLTSVTLPSDITTIDQFVFSGCSSLEELTVPFVGSSKSATTSSSDTLFGYLFGTNNYRDSLSVYQYYSSSYGTTYFIPSSLRSVTVLGGELLYGAFYNCNSLTAVTLGDEVQSVQSRAFYNCGRVESVTFGEDSQCTEIGAYAFYNCINLASVDIPFGIESIADDTFYECSNLTSIELPTRITSVGAYAFYNCSSLENVTFGEDSQCTSIGANAFYGCGSLTSIELPTRITSVGTYAFYNCSALENVTFGEDGQCTSIGAYAFYGCGSLTSIELPTGITGIADATFYGCRSLTSLEIPAGVTSIGASAFYNCSSLESVTFEKGSQCTSIYSASFYGCGSLVEMTLPFVGNSQTASSASNSTLFGYIFGSSNYTGGRQVYQYYSSSYNATYYIPSSLRSVTILGGNVLYGAFYNCTMLTSITLEDEVQSVGSRAFYGCGNLQEMTLPFIGSSKSAYSASSYTLFGYIFGTASYTGSTSVYQYYSSGSYSTYYIPSSLRSVTILGGNVLYGAFYNCNMLTSVTLGEEVQSVQSHAFYGCGNLQEITLPFVGGNKSAYSASSSTLFGYIFGTSSYSGSTSVYQYYSESSYYTYCIPLSLRSVTILGGNVLYGAFYDCTMLTYITLGEEVQSVQEMAFFGCSSLENVTFEKESQCTTIGDYAFQNCYALESVTFGENSLCTSIGIGAIS